MNLQNNTILITGGSSGIGLEMAKRLTYKGNKVLICGRSQDKLDQVKKQIPEIDIFSCDLANPQECKGLFNWVQAEYPSCNILINNAAIVYRTPFAEDDHILQKADSEIQTNLMAPIRLAHYFLPLIEKNPNPAIINITTGLVFAPKTEYTFYNATKAGLHAFTQVLRKQLENRPVSVIEALFPAVDTPWHEGHPPGIAISPEKAVKDMLAKLEKGQTEIMVGKVKLLYRLSRLAPSFAMKKINQG